MATRLPQLQGGQVQIGGVPNAVLPEVQFGQRDVSTAYQAQARYQQSVSSVIDRMTRTVFGVAEGMSQRAGLQFAAENPLTNEQLDAMSRGDMSEVSLGSPLNVFNSAVRKARAIEVSGHAEVEAREQMVLLLEKANMGEMDATQVQDQIAAITNGYGESLAQIDPDASYKFRATMAAVGGRVIEKVAELDGQKRMIGNTVKVQRLYATMQQEIALAATTKFPIDPATGRERSSAEFIDTLKSNFLSNAQALIGINGAAQYVNSIDNDINTSKISAITQYLNTDPSFANSNSGIERLLRGDAGSASNAFQLLLPEDRERVIGDYRSLKAQRRADMEAAEGRANKAQQVAVREQIFKFHDPNTTEDERVAIGRSLAASSVVTASQIETFLNPKQDPGSPVDYERLLREVQRGTYSEITQIEEIGAELGMNQTQIGKLVNAFTQTETKQQRLAGQIIRQYSGVPEQVLSFTNDKEAKKFEKNNEINTVLDDLVAEFRQANPGTLVPFAKLAKDAIDVYESATGAADGNAAALARITLVLENEAKKADQAKNTSLAASYRNIVVSPDMDTDDLLKHGKIGVDLKNSIDSSLAGIR